MKEHPVSIHKCNSCVTQFDSNQNWKNTEQMFVPVSHVAKICVNLNIKKIIAIIMSLTYVENITLIPQTWKITCKLNTKQENYITS